VSPSFAPTVVEKAQKGDNHIYSGEGRQLSKGELYSGESSRQLSKGELYSGEPRQLSKGELYPGSGACSLGGGGSGTS
jgi:hypothetical protein